jgi:tetratricopeptide (TPR) repeat protein
MKLSMISLKTFFLSLMLIGAGSGLFAQKQLDKAKEQLEKKKYNEARTEIDNFLANEKNMNNSEAWYVKAKVYSSIAVDSVAQASVPDAKTTSMQAIKKYIELEKANVKDSAKRFMHSTLDNRKALTDLYSAYSKEAASYYNAGNFNDALAGFQGSLQVFDVLANEGWTSGMKLDTISVLYAGISAEKANKLDTAANYYGKIAESKAKAQGYESIYKWLADYYKNKGDMDKASKYTALGKEVYPDDPFWLGFEVNMLSEKGDKEKLFAKYDEVTKANPSNPIFFYNYAVELYKTAYNEDTTQRPANADELTEKAVEMAKKSIELDPKYPNSRMLLGQIYYNQGVDLINKNKAIRPKGNVKLNAAQLKQKEDLRQASSKKFDEAVENFVKIDELLGGQGKLKMEEKQFLKDSYDLLITIYEQKQNTEKAAVYTDKFNNVDKVH